MGDYTYSSEVVLSELLRISSNIIWKNPSLALENENPETAIEAEQYNLAYQGKLTFDLVFQFDVEALVNAGLDRDFALSAIDSPYTIPEYMRELCAKKQSEYILTHYNEGNNYYRMLNGLPDNEDTQFFYNTLYPDISDSDTPIHLLDSNQLYLLQNTGFISKLIKENPTKKYLQYLTDRKINIYTARNSEEYSLLWVINSSYSTLLNDFVETYNACRYMVLKIYYSRNLKTDNSEYVGFIGMTILFATINQILRKFLDADITRDFYDKNSLKYVYDSYGVPFYSAIPMEYHKKLVNKMNILISHKGSTRVFYDIFDVFGFDAMYVFEYYMMKIHKFKDGKPVFKKKKDGTYDLQEMYDILFAKVQLYKDPTSEMLNSKNYVDYEDMIRNDPYWINDANLINKIYSEEYNYMESKYLGTQTTFNLMKIIYESSYYLKMIIDNRETLDTTVVYNSSINANSNLFELVIYACALITKKYGFQGNIPTDPHIIGKVMGFNFKDDLVVLKKNIDKNDYLKNDTNLLNMLETMNVNSLESIEKVYTNLTNLRSYITEKIANTREIDEYWAYYELYQSLMYSEYVDDVFAKSDGTIAISFADLLQDISDALYNRYDNDESYDVDEELSDTLYLLKNSCSKLTQIQYSDNINIDMIVEYMFKLLDFFKSAKAELTGFEILYSLVSRSENVMKLLAIIGRISEKIEEPIYSIIDELSDLILCAKDFMNLISKYKLDDKICNIEEHTLIKSQIEYLEDFIKIISCIIYDLTEDLNLTDEIYLKEAYLLPESPINFGDNVKLLKDEVMEILKFFVYDEFTWNEVITHISDIIYGNDSDSITKNEFIAKLKMSLIYSKLQESTSLSDKVSSLSIKASFESKYWFETSLIKIYNKIHGLSSNNNMRDSAFLIAMLHTLGNDGKLELTEDLDKLLYEEISLLYKDITKNYIQYRSQLIQDKTVYFIRNEYFTGDKFISLRDSDEVLSDEDFYQFDEISENDNLLGTIDFIMNDTVTLKYEKVYED